MKPPRILAAWLLVALAGAAGAQESGTPPGSPPQVQRAGLEQRVGNLEAQLQTQGLIGLLNQLQALKTEVARLRGMMEEQAHLARQLEQRQKTLYADLDERLKRLDEGLGGQEEQLQRLAEQVDGLRASVKAGLSAPEARAIPAESVRLQPARSLGAVTEPALAPLPEDVTQAYDAALNQFKAGDYPGAVLAFQAFYGQHTGSSLAPNALYWMGLAYAVQGEYIKAAAAYEKLIAEHAASTKVPDALVSLARSYLQLGDTAAARKQLDAVLARYPASKSAESARKLLDTLE